MKKSVKQNSAFTLIEMIGVLAIIGILAAVVAPRVIESIRDAKVTSAVASVSAAKTAAIGYYQRYDNFPLDEDLTTVFDYKSDPVNPVAYTPAVGDLDFGDVLVRQSQLLEQEKAPIGRPDAQSVHAIGCALSGHLNRWRTIPRHNRHYALQIVRISYANCLLFHAQLNLTRSRGIGS